MRRSQCRLLTDTVEKSLEEPSEEYLPRRRQESRRRTPPFEQRVASAGSSG
jgi:hypothetical protein